MIRVHWIAVLLYALTLGAMGCVTGVIWRDQEVKLLQRDNFLLHKKVDLPVNCPEALDTTDKWIPKDLRPGVPESVLGACARCKRSWKWVAQHYVTYSRRNGSSVGYGPICEQCWHDTSQAERLKYFEQGWETNIGTIGKDPEIVAEMIADLDLIRSAVIRDSKKEGK